MIKLRKFLSVLIAFVVMIAVFNGYSVGVKAADDEITITCTVDSNGQFINISEGGQMYRRFTPQSNVATFTVHFIITNAYGNTIEVGPRGGTGVQIADGTNGTYDMIFSRANGTNTNQTQVAVAKYNNAELPGSISYGVYWEEIPSGGGGSSSGTSSASTPSGSGSSSSSTSATSVSHSHSYTWEDVRPATEDDNGEMIYKCECGEVLYRVPTSAYYVFNRNTTEKIKSAKQGATVKIETSRWISFHKMVMQALADRPDVSLEVSFLDGEYKGNRVSFTIPAGTDTLSLLDDNGFAGFLYLADKFGTTN